MLEVNIVFLSKLKILRLLQLFINIDVVSKLNIYDNKNISICEINDIFVFVINDSFLLFYVICNWFFFMYWYGKYFFLL